MSKSNLKAVATAIKNLTYEDLRRMAGNLQYSATDDERGEPFDLNSQEEWAEALYWWAENELEND